MQYTKMFPQRLDSYSHKQVNILGLKHAESAFPEFVMRPEKGSMGLVYLATFAWH